MSSTKTFPEERLQDLEFKLSNRNSNDGLSKSNMYNNHNSNERYCNHNIYNNYSNPGKQNNNRRENVKRPTARNNGKHGVSSNGPCFAISVTSDVIDL